MAGSSNTNNVPKGTTLFFGSWAIVTPREASPATLSSHLVMPNSPKPRTRSQLAGIRESADLDEKEFHPNSTRITQKTCQLQPKLLVQSSLTQILIPKNPTFPKLLKNI